MRRGLGALVVLAGLMTVLGVLMASGGGGRVLAAPHTPAPADNTPLPTHSHHTPEPAPTPPGDQTPAPDQTPVPVAPATPPPASPPSSTAPVPTGPAVGTEVTPQGLVTVPAATVGPTPQSGSSDVTLLILAVIAGLALTAVGAFVLAIAMQ